MATQLNPALDAPDIARSLPAACFKLAALTALIGVSLGVYMGVAQDHTLAPVHVHLNLIGWVSMFLFGLYYNARKAATGFLAVIQVTLSGVGYIAMLGGLTGFLLSGDAAFMPLAIIGSLLVWSGFALFLLIVLRTA